MLKKNIKWLILAISIILVVIIIFLLNNEKVIDYTNLKESEIFMSSFADYLEDLPIKNSKTSTYCLFKVVDENDKPIEGATIKLYKITNEQITLETNKDGIAGVSGLERGTYNFKQTKTADGLALMEDYQEVNLLNENCNFTIKNTKKESTIKNNNEKQIVNLESVEHKENRKSDDNFEEEYLFLKDELVGEKLIIDYQKEKKEDNVLKRKCMINITNSFIKEIKIELDSDEEKIVNSNNKVTNVFKDNESFYLISNNDELKEVKAKLIITFEKDGKTYKVFKNVILGKNEELGKINIINKTDKNLNIKIKEVNLSTNEEKDYEEFTLNKKIEATINKVPSGSYKINVYDNKKLKSFIYLEVENGKKTQYVIYE